MVTVKKTIDQVIKPTVDCVQCARCGKVRAPTEPQIKKASICAFETLCPDCVAGLLSYVKTGRGKA